ncbi:MAG: 50S ribosomal protein L18e [Sulfolobales archaeon]|nr:50S ribosomal protein L18e [Sulfolobales archaeon]MCX8199605.1 50S ribosomal protein L18e [Sulfolobales archaeon]MDW8170558.1 50S ribosomal protein L18e [Desulfurococcaceae archaeon]
MRRTGPTNIVIRRTIDELKRASSRGGGRVWRTIAELLEKPRRKRIAVNVGRINKYVEPGEVVVVPGKVIGAGELKHPVTVAAIAFSSKALEKIKSVNGRALHILDLLRENPSGKGVKIIG